MNRPTLPPSLIYQDISFRRARPEDVQKLRSMFSKDIKMCFLHFLFENHTADLKKMGISDEGLTHMERGEFPRNHPGEQLDCTIDHILSLALGGTNDFENLMLIPARFNALKNDFEMSQLAHGAAEGTLTTLIPAQGDKVPYIEGGFKRLTGRKFS